MLGQEFRGGDVVCLQAPSNVSFPTFGQIIWILVPEDLKILVVKKLRTEAYLSHYNAYHINGSTEYATIFLSELVIHEAFTLHKSSLVVLRSCCHVELFV